jgi:hypothetical protein
MQKNVHKNTMKKMRMSKNTVRNYLLSLQAIQKSAAQTNGGASA